jgi:TRAP-type mannitol/chloroaromatic compound transport system permease small subunit
MRLLLGFADGVDRISRGIGRLLIWAVLASVLLAAGSALSRKLFAYYFNWWSELQWYLFGAVFLLGAAHMLQLDEHVRVDVLARRWSARSRAVLELIALCAVAVPISALMAWLGFEHAWSAFRHAEHSYMADGLVIWPVRALVPVGFVLFGLQSLAEIVRRVEVLRSPRAPAASGESAHAAGRAP